MRHVFIFGRDEKSRFLRRLPGALADYFTAQGGCYEILETGTPEEAVRASREACLRPGEVRLYACGSDGLLHDVVCGAAGFTHAAVGVMPGGGAHDFADSLGGMSLLRRIDDQIGGCILPVDLLRVQADGLQETAYALCHIALGRPPSARPSADPKHAWPFRTQTDGEDVWTQNSCFGLCANIPCWEGRNCMRQADPGGGRMAFALLPAGSRLFELAAMDKLRQGRCAEVQGARLGLCSKMEIEAPEPFPFRLDGRSGQTRRMRVELLPRRLRLILPGLSGADNDKRSSGFVRQAALRASFPTALLTLLDGSGKEAAGRNQ